ncbi:MAG: FAD-dependent oxidoreductase [Candidatus Methanofastidiosia archaeon]
MKEKEYEFVIIGSGAGGATLGNELTKRGKDVLIVERGDYIKTIGGPINSAKYVDKVISKEGINIMRALMAGGTTVISAGCSIRCLEQRLLEFNIDLKDEFKEAEKEMGIAPIPEFLLSERSKRLQKTAMELGYSMKLMPKCITPAMCKKCGQCMMGCRQKARWTALEYLDKAIKNGADVIYNTTVTRVIHANGKATGIEGIKGRKKIEIKAPKVILSAGALSTPVILQNSGIDNAGKNLSVDLLKHVYGFIQDAAFSPEPQMALIDIEFYDKKGFILSPNINYAIVKKYIKTKNMASTLSPSNAIGLMIKIKDKSNGTVYPDGTISKGISNSDTEKFNDGTKIARKILIKAGANKNTIFESHINGAHPAGTAAIGKVVDSNLQTRINGLYVCDASAFPQGQGLPTILTIVALAKRLGKNIS